MRLSNRHIVPILLTLAVACSNPCECTNPVTDYEAWVLISEVTDGDTYVFMLNGERMRVRLLGVDCFEVRRGDRLSEQADSRGISEDSALNLGFEARHLADSLLTGREAKISRDSSEPNSDGFGRLLRHVRSGETDIAILMTERGYSI